MLAAHNKMIEIIKSFFTKSLYFYEEMTFKPYVKKYNIIDTAFDFIIGSPMSKAWYDSGSAGASASGDWVEMRFIKDNIIEKGDVILECGGFHGCMTIALSKWIGKEGKIITFEANPKNAEILRQNVKLNNLSNVIVEEKAVGSYNGKIDAFKAIGPRRHFLLRSKKLDSVKLDNYIDYNPTFLKVDVEGYELEVLKGAQKILNKSPKLAIEIHYEQLHRYGASVSEILKLLDLRRYHCWVQWSEAEEPRVFDGKEQISAHVHLFAVPKHIR